MAVPFLFRFVVQTLRLQPILKGLSGDADHVADADRLEQSGVCEFIGRAAAEPEDGCGVIHGVCSALGRPFFVGAHKTISLANIILKSCHLLSKYSCNHHKIHMGGFGYFQASYAFLRESFESIISFLTYRGNANIAETYEANRRAWRSCTTLSCLYSIIIPFRDSHAFLHDQADRGTQRPGYGSNLCRFSYCGRQNHRRFWSPRWKPRPLRLTLRSRNHPG